MCTYEEIVELFEEIQETYSDRIKREAVTLLELTVHRVSKDTAHRAAYFRAYQAKSKHAEIRERLLRGERPKTSRRPPTRWYRVADELGIDIGQPKVST
jgi:hypothetical protein